MVRPKPIPKSETMKPEKQPTMDAIQFSLLVVFRVVVSFTIVLTFHSNLDCLEIRDQALVHVLEDLFGASKNQIDMDPSLLARKLNFQSSSRSRKQLITQIMIQEKLKLELKENGRYLIGPNPFFNKQGQLSDYQYDRAPIEQVLASLFHSMNADFILHQNLSGIQVSLKLRQVQAMDVLQMISRLYDLQVVEFNGIYSVRKQK